MSPTAGNQYDIALFKNDIAAGREAHMAAPLDHKMEPRGLLICWNGNGPRWRIVGTEVKCSFEPDGLKDITQEVEHAGHLVELDAPHPRCMITDFASHVADGLGSRRAMSASPRWIQRIDATPFHF